MSKKKHILVLDERLGKVKRRGRGSFTAEDVRRRIALYVGAGVVGVLALLLIVFGVGTVITEIIAPDKVPATAPVREEEFGEADSLAVLTLKLTDDRSAVDKMVISRFEPTESRVYCCGLSPSLLYGERTLGEYYAEEGVQALTDALADMLDCSRVFTFTLTYNEMRHVIRIFDGVTVTVPYMINYTSPNGDRNINVAAGTRVYTGGELSRLLEYPGWVGGEREHLLMYTSVVAQIINENLNCTSSDKLKEILFELSETAETDITSTDFQHCANGLVYLCSINRSLTADDEPLAAVLDLWPSETDGEGRLVLSDDDLLHLRAAFGKRESTKG